MKDIKNIDNTKLSSDFLLNVEKESKKYWKEINTGHDYSIIDSYTLFYSICVLMAEFGLSWKEKSENIEYKEKICSVIKKLKNNLIRGACSSQINMETNCKEEAYNEVLDILNSIK